MPRPSAAAPTTPASAPAAQTTTPTTPPAARQAATPPGKARWQAHPARAPEPPGQAKAAPPAGPAQPEPPSNAAEDQADAAALPAEQPAKTETSTPQATPADAPARKKEVDASPSKRLSIPEGGVRKNARFRGMGGCVAGFPNPPSPPIPTGDRGERRCAVHVVAVCVEWLKRGFKARGLCVRNVRGRFLWPVRFAPDGPGLIERLRFLVGKVGKGCARALLTGAAPPVIQDAVLDWCGIPGETIVAWVTVACRFLTQKPYTTH